MKNTKIEKNTKESDHKSGSFSVSTKISEECFKLLDEKFENKKHLIRCLAFLHDFNLAYENRKFEKCEYMPFGTSMMSEYYQKYKKLLKVLVDNEILLVGEIGFGQRATTYKINEKYIENEQIKIVFDSELEKYFHVHQVKSSKRARSCMTNLSVTCDIDYDTFLKEMLDYGKSVEETIEQWEVITKLNSKKRLYGKMYKKMSRIYGNFHQLSKPVNTRMKIGGRSTVSIDQHSTYMTILPSILRTQFEYLKNDELNEEIQLFHDFVSTSSNIYQEISNETTLTVKQVKIALLSWICEPKSTYYGDLIQIDEWMNNNFPLCKDKINKLRSYGDSFVSSQCVRIESLIFNTASRQMNQMGYPAITKHDQLNCWPEHMNYALEILDQEFCKHWVPNRVKVDNRPTDLIPSVSDPLDFCPFKNNQNRLLSKRYKIYNLRLYTYTLLPVFAFLKGTKSKKSKNRSQGTESLKGQTRNRESKVGILKDGRFFIKIKGTKICSKKGENMEQFKTRIELERSDVGTKRPQLKSLTPELEDVILEESSEKPVEAVFSLDDKKMSNDEVNDQKPVEELKNNVYEVAEEDMDDFTRHILKHSEFVKMEKVWKKLGVVK